MVCKDAAVNTVNKKNAGLKERSTSEKTSLPEEAEPPAELEKQAAEGPGKCSGDSRAGLACWYLCS